MFNLYETYKFREIFGEFDYLVEKFTVAETGIFSGEHPGQVKAINHSPHGVRGSKGPWRLAKFHFSKRFKVVENEFIFQKSQHFSSPKE